MDDDMASSGNSHACYDFCTLVARLHNAGLRRCNSFAARRCPCSHRSSPSKRCASRTSEIGEEDDTRFALTSEAGLNDGLAFPFIMCAIAMAEAGRTGEPWLLRWIGIEVFWRLAIGVGVGVLLGYALGWLVFRMPNRAKLSRTGDGFVALGITVTVYGIAEALHGYGFVSVFVAGLAYGPQSAIINITKLFMIFLSNSSVF